MFLPLGLVNFDAQFLHLLLKRCYAALDFVNHHSEHMRENANFVMKIFPSIQFGKIMVVVAFADCIGLLGQCSDGSGDYARDEENGNCHGKVSQQECDQQSVADGMLNCLNVASLKIDADASDQLTF